ncbi:MFS transporter [Yinghuangia sp. YIM S10712]|uniref:MFS transporter n=1 Tax=Yinghuangia sp. YIM S10712 TaxID=3436930 RepID=UPI003F53A1E1
MPRPTPEHPIPASAKKPVVTLVVVLLGYLVLPMGMSGTTVAVHRIGTDLDASGASLQWVVTGYFLAASSLMLVAGSLGDLFGRRRVYRLGAIVYGSGCAFSAAAPDILALDIARTVTGIGAAGVMAGGGAIVATTFSGPARTRAFAAVGTTGGVGLALGPTVAGWLVGALGWRATFGLFGSIGCVLIVGTWALAESRATDKPRLDRAGTATFVAGLALTVFAITQGSEAGWTSARVLGPALAGLLLLTVFTAIERRAERPVLDLSLLRNRRFAGWLLAALTTSVGIGGMLVYLPVYLQGVNDLSSDEAGLTMLMMTLPVLVLPSVSGRLVTRGVPPRLVVVTALLLLAAGNALLTVLHPGIGALQLLVPLLLAGSGMGLASGLIDGQAMTEVDPARAGMASGLVSTVRGTTQSLVLALFGSALITILDARLGSPDAAGRVAAGDVAPIPGLPGIDPATELTDAWRLVLAVVAGVVLLSALVVLRLLRAAPADRGDAKVRTFPRATHRPAETSVPVPPADAVPDRQPIAARSIDACRRPSQCS